MGRLLTGISGPGRSLTRWQLNRAKRGARAKRTPVGRDPKATWVAGPEAGVHLVCWSNSKWVCSAGVAGETGGMWGPLGLDFD